MVQQRGLNLWHRISSRQPPLSANPFAKLLTLACWALERRPHKHSVKTKPRKQNRKGLSASLKHLASMKWPLGFVKLPYQGCHLRMPFCSSKETYLVPPEEHTFMLARRTCKVTLRLCREICSRRAPFPFHNAPRMPQNSGQKARLRQGTFEKPWVFQGQDAILRCRCSGETARLLVHYFCKSLGSVVGCIELRHELCSAGPKPQIIRSEHNHLALLKKGSHKE